MSPALFEARSRFGRAAGRRSRIAVDIEELHDRIRRERVRILTERNRASDLLDGGERAVRVEARESEDGRVAVPADVAPGPKTRAAKDRVRQCAQLAQCAPRMNMFLARTVLITPPV